MPGCSCAMEKKVKKKRARSVGNCDAVETADADSDCPALGVAQRESDAVVEQMVKKRRKSRAAELVMDTQAGCSPGSHASSGQLSQELDTVEDRVNGDDSPSAATCRNGSIRSRELDGDSVQLMSSNSFKKKAKKGRISGEPSRAHESNGELGGELGPSSPPVKLTRKERRERRERDGVKGVVIEQSLKEEQIVKLPEEDRVWQYVQKRAVYVSPPAPTRKLDKLNARNPSCRGQGQYGVTNGQSMNDSLPCVKTNVVDLTFDGDVVKVTLTRESEEVRKWIQRQSVRRFGLDLEWQPNRLKGGKENKVSLMQLSTGSECLLVQMLYLDSIPDELVQLLKDPERVFAGVGILNDAKKLERDHGLVCKGEVELTTLAVAHFKDQELKKVGLKALAKKVLQFDICKSKKLTMSNWARLHLSRSQVEYASLDAWVSLAIYSKLDRVSQVATA